MDTPTTEATAAAKKPMLDARELSGETEPVQARQLERVVDVPLSVTLRFGQRAMRLRDVLELNTGSLVELDREVEEPVDLVLGDRVIARGEVVIVDGNYGLRVQEIIERLPPSSLDSSAQTAAA